MGLAAVCILTQGFCQFYTGARMFARGGKARRVCPVLYAVANGKNINFTFKGTRQLKVVLNTDPGFNTVGVEFQRESAAKGCLQSLGQLYAERDVCL